MQKNDLVSIVMATFNGEKYLPLQLDSIVTQDYGNIEVVIVDDCSADKTVDIIREFARRDNRIRLVTSAVNKGGLAAFERGLSLARGQFIALADQDDIWDADKVSAMASALRENPNADLAIADLRLIDGTGEVIAESMWKYQRLRPREGYPFRQLLYMNFVTGCATMARKRLIERAVPFPADCMVHDWWLSVLASSERNGGLLLVRRPLVSYRQHGSNAIGAHSGNIMSAVERAPDLTARIIWYNKNLERIKGYLAGRREWGPRDLHWFREVERLFQGYVDEAGKGLLFRLIRLPLRVRYAGTQSLSHLAGILVFTIFPGIVDFARRLFPAVGSKRKA